MYNRTLRIALFGLDDAVAEAVKAQQAPPRFTFEFERAEAVDLEVARACSVVIATMPSLGSVPLADLSAAAREGKLG